MRTPEFYAELFGLLLASKEATVPDDQNEEIIRAVRREPEKHNNPESLERFLEAVDKSNELSKRAISAKIVLQSFLRREGFLRD